jgi:phosphate acetyltransferase
MLRSKDALQAIFALSKGKPPVTTAVVHPCDRESLLGAFEAAAKRLIVPVLVGPEAKIRAAAAAKIKEIDSPVAGDPDILVVPDLDGGNLLAKTLSYLAGAESAGVVLGARVPIVLTSRADSARTREASAAVMVLLAHSRRRQPAPR